jgi:formyl-CoA transferase
VIPEQEGNHHPQFLPMGCFRTADGWVNVAGPSGRLLRNFCKVIGLPELPSDPRFDSPGKRFANRAALNEIVAARLRARPTQEWITALNEAGVPCGPVYRMDEVFADPQVTHLGMTAPVEHPALGRIEVIRNAVRMTDADATVRAPTPESGQHSDEVLREIGLAEAEIAELRKRGIV